MDLDIKNILNCLNFLLITHFSLKNGTVKWLKDILIIYNSYLMVIYFQLTPTEISKL
jgi:hypothetical protein